MKRYIKSETSLATSDDIIKDIVGKDIYIEISYDAEDRHPMYRKSLWVKFDRVTDKLYVTRGFDWWDLYLKNRYNEHYPPQYRQLKKDRVTVVEPVVKYTLADLYKMADDSHK